MAAEGDRSMFSADVLPAKHDLSTEKWTSPQVPLAAMVEDGM